MIPTKCGGRMTRAYALYQLLRHGPMTFPELLDCTGWSESVLRLAKEHLLSLGVLVRFRVRWVSGVRYAWAAKELVQ